MRSLCFLLDSRSRLGTTEQRSAGEVDPAYWTTRPGGVFVKALPHFNRGYGNDSSSKGQRPQESVTEAPSAHSPSLSEVTLRTLFNGPRPPDPRPKTKAAVLSSARMGWRAARHQRSAFVSSRTGRPGTPGPSSAAGSRSARRAVQGRRRDFEDVVYRTVTLLASMIGSRRLTGAFGGAERSKLSVKLLGVTIDSKVRSSSRSSVTSVAWRRAGRRSCCDWVSRVRFQGQGRRALGVVGSLLDSVGTALIAANSCAKARIDSHRFASGRRTEVKTIDPRFRPTRSVFQAIATFSVRSREFVWPVLSVQISRTVTVCADAPSAVPNNVHREIRVRPANCVPSRIRTPTRPGRSDPFEGHGRCPRPTAL